MRPEIFDRFNNYADFDINPWSYDFEEYFLKPWNRQNSARGKESIRHLCPFHVSYTLRYGLGKAKKKSYQFAAPESIREYQLNW